MIIELINEKIRANNLSFREAGREIGVAHTTVIRVLEGKSIDLDTMTKIAAWLEVDPSTLLDAGGNDLASKIAVFLQREPELSSELERAMMFLEDRKLKPETLRDLLTYMTYRIQLDDLA